MDLADLRCSDADRERVAELLRGHAGVGRLTVEELDERVAAAFAARTQGDLAVLLRDLPSGPPSRSPAPKPAKKSGVVPFAETWKAPGDSERAMNDLMAYVTPPLARAGYALVEHGPHRLVFKRSRRPVWTILVAIFVFPLGLLALIHQDEQQVVIDLQPSGRDTLVSATGIGPAEVRRAFATLER